ncbi:hypothetical protein PsorP6_015988 [Peronosclerospora sorghi]|uniref:Uncharacterized protein n=1 Tax=Peronosclerospora sorghi TaxID=230839 RepID=A0ACC0WNL1_9STRA|nr:hypothetical protein PsorP6_015988 [Peronosclerospora sorghi]
MTASILSQLQRRRLNEVPVTNVLDSIRSVYGLVPLGGQVGGDGGVTPPLRAALTLSWDGIVSVDKSKDEQDETKLWQLLLTSAHLPSTGSETELRTALETIQEEEKQHQTEETHLNIDSVRAKYFAARRVFFAVRIELFRAAIHPHHPNAQTAKEVVDELLREGLRDALLDEIHGRQFFQPPQLQGVSKVERKALLDWQLQFLEEETLLRDLLLLTLVASRETTTLKCAVKIAKTVYNWETRVFQEVFTSSTLIQPVAQEMARKLTQVGLLVVIRLLDTTCDALEEDLRQATKDFFLTKVNVPSVLLLAWAALLGQHYRIIEVLNQDSENVEEFKVILQQTLAAAERLHSFHCFNLLLRSLVSNIKYEESDYLRRRPFLQPTSLNAKNLWTLPNVAATAGLNMSQPQTLPGYNTASIYQVVSAVFLDNMLSSLGYLENIDDVQQLHAMVSFLLPALSSTCVAQPILGIDMESGMMHDVVGPLVALRELLSKARAYLPHSFLPCIEMFTALCCNNQEASSPIVIRQVLKYFNKPRAELETISGIYHPLPPREYYTEIEGRPDRIQCTQSFAYGDANERLVVPSGTIGTIVRNEDNEQVDWLLSDNGGDAFSLWDFLTFSAERFVADVQSNSFTNLHRAKLEDIKVLISFFEFIVQLGQLQDDAQLVVEEIERRWGEARLRRWWINHQLPSPEIYIPQLLKQQISLPTLLSASRENLVSWGIRDRFTREQVLVHLGNQGNLNADSVNFGLVFGGIKSGMTSFGMDGGVHLLRLLLRVLEGFLNTTHESKDDDAMEDDSDGCTPYLHLAVAAFIALRTVLTTTSGVELLVNSFGNIQEDCVSLIVQSGRKIFEIQERLTGEYLVVLATLDIFMSLVRWFCFKEAQSLTDPAFSYENVSCVGNGGFIANERLWFVSAVEFAIDVLSAYESWKFVTATDRCEVAERCYRLLYVLVLPRKYVHERNDMVPSFETTLCQTLSTDMSLLVKLMRSSCALYSAESLTNYRKSITAGDENDVRLSTDAENNALFLLKFLSESNLAEADIERLESLVTTCLRFVVLLITNPNNMMDVQLARKFLLAPIHGGDPKMNKMLTIVSLCWGYIGYSLEKAPAVAYWSLQLLQRAAVVLDYRNDNENSPLSFMNSMGAPFYGHQNLRLICRLFVQLLRISPTQRLPLQKEVITMLALCLEHQPSFVALVLFGDYETNDFKSTDTTNTSTEEVLRPFVVLLEGFFEASERLLEQASDLFCTLLAFLVQIWRGATHNHFGIHQKILTTLEKRPSFWSNVTRALKIHMPLDSVEERGLLDMMLAAATAQGRGNLQTPSGLSEVYLGRSSAYGYLARGLILQFVSYEWHHQASKQSNHSLMEVLDSYREEGLYSHWLRTFTRLDYSSTQMRQYASYLQRVCKRSVPSTNLLREVSVSGISTYLEGLICNVSTLTWQLSGGDNSQLKKASADVGALKLIQWGNLQAAYLHAQLFSLAKWKVFMELCCLQTGEAADSAPDSDESGVPTTTKPFKRKDSMISSPIHTSGSSYFQDMGATSGSASSSEDTMSSRFFGDLTSFGLIRVLADVINTRVSQHEILDYFVLVHLHDLVKLLVSMLHHQLCLIVRKTRDPKLSRTRRRLEESSDDSNLKLKVDATQKLLAVVVKAITAVQNSIEQLSREVGLPRLSQVVPQPSIECTSASLTAFLVANFEQKLESVIDRLFTSLFTAALLLVRHMSQIREQLPHSTTQATQMDTDSQPRPPLQVNLLGHCTKAIALCDDRKQPTKSSRALFQLSCCLFQEILDSLTSVDSKSSGVSMLRMATEIDLNPVIGELTLDQQGISALFHLLVQRFRPSSYSKEVAAKQKEACQILRGLVAVVWNSTMYATSRLHVISMLGSQLVPLLQTQMEREEASSKLRGYTLSVCQDIKTDTSEVKEKLERSVAHRMWCLVLDFVAGLVRLQVEPSSVESDLVNLWDFISRAESLLLAAVTPIPSRRLTYASIAEHQALLRLLNALSGNVSRRKRWRHAFPTNTVILMEQSRQLLRRACVLLSSSSTEKFRQHPEIVHKPKSEGKGTNTAILSSGGLASRSPQSPRSPSAFPYSHPSLLHDHLQAVLDVEKQRGAKFYHEMELELVEIVRLASFLLTKWTASSRDRNILVVLDGVCRVDEEQLLPLLDLIPPSEARSMNGSPGLGHLMLAMDFSLDQLLVEEDVQPEARTTLVLKNTLEACALLFLKTYLLYSEHYEVPKRDRGEFKKYVRKLNARLGDRDSVGVDLRLLQHIEKVRRYESKFFSGFH